MFFYFVVTAKLQNKTMNNIACNSFGHFCRFVINKKFTGGDLSG